MNKMKQVSVAMPMGLGDLHWIMIKLESWKKSLDIQHLDVSVFKDMRHGSAKGFLEMVPFVDSVSVINAAPHFIFDKNPLHSDLRHVSLSMEFNSCLESGQSIESIFPELKTDFGYDLQIPAKGESFASDVIRDVGGRPALLYVSSEAMNNSWRSMAPKEWATILNGLQDATGVKTCVVGAEWDRSYSEKVMSLADESAYVNLVGATDISSLLALIKQARLIIGFPSGLPIIATKFWTPSIMFWPKGKWHERFRHCWVEPSVIRADRYKAIDFQTQDAKPENVLSCALDMVTNNRSVQT